MSALREGMANGPSRFEDIEKNGHIWERPWTVEEIRQHSANWSLAADSGLFLFLQDFSQRMLSKTHEIEKQLDGLIRDTKATDSRLHSVFNDFLMLSNTQFIENRVYDDEVEETISKTDGLEKIPEQEKTREQKEAELIPKMQEAVKYGLQVLESAFEHLDIKAGNSDSEDEEVTDRVEAILEPKDLYVDRPLPYLIGSQAFLEQDDVGLGDLSSDEMSVDSDRDSVIESEDDKEAVHSDDDFDQKEIAHNNIKKKPSMISYEEEEEDEDSDIFGESDKDDDDDRDPKFAGPSSFADELAARIKGESAKKPDGDRASLTSKKSKTRKEAKPAKSRAAEADEDSDDMFKPPRMDDDNFSPFGGKSGLFSGGRGLFDDDDEGDLFSEAPKPMSEEKRALDEGIRSTAQTAESTKKIPAGAMSIFPDNSLFTSKHTSDSEESKENGTSGVKTNAVPKLAPMGAGVAGGGGLFDEEDEDDDFFSGKSPKKSDSAVQEKPKPKKALDLFYDEDEEDGDIFNDKSSPPLPSQSKKQSKKEVVVEKAKLAEKKILPGAVSMFGPGTKSLLSEGLKKRQPSTSEESEKSEQSGTAEDGKDGFEQRPKSQTRGLFSDDEDSQIFPPMPKSQSKPEPASKIPSLLFDDEEEEDLFASAAKSKPKLDQAQASTPKPTKPSSSLFSDDEDEWIISKSSTEKPESKTGGMKTSASAPSSLPNAKTSQKSSLFDDDEDDLFAPKKDSSQKQPQRGALLFEDEGNDEEKGSLFGVKATVNTNTEAPAKTEVVTPHTTPPSENVEVLATAAKSKPPKPAEKTSEAVSSSQESTESKKKPAGAVSLFGGIDVLANKHPKSPLDEADSVDIFLAKDTSSPNLSREENKEDKGKVVSLFDEEEKDESDWKNPKFTPSKPKVIKHTEEQQPQAKSTDVFQDEDLLFTRTQQRDNDPDVDLFATSGNDATSKQSLVNSAAGLFVDDEDEDDLFNSSKPIPPPKVAEKPSKPNDKAPLASPEPLSEIQASLMINPAALLPGSSSTTSEAQSSSSGVSSSSLSPSPATTPVAAHAESEGGVSFDAPVQVTTLQSTNKGRVKVSAPRKPQSRAARQQAAQRSIENVDEKPDEDAPGPNPSVSSSSLPPPNKSSHIRINSDAPPTAPTPTPSQPSPLQITPRPSELTLPVSTNTGKKGPSKDAGTSKMLQPSDDDDIFGSDSLFGANSVTNQPSTREAAKSSLPQASSQVSVKKDEEKSTFPSIFDDNIDDLFQTLIPRTTAKSSKASSFLEDDNDDDIFGLSNSSTPSSTSSKEIKSSISFLKQDIFQEEASTVVKAAKKDKEMLIDASLFDDDVDIFADLTDTFKPKQKSKAKGEIKSIFDDDMDDIFSTSAVKPAPKAAHKSEKTPPSQDSSTAADSSNIFDDPLNALGGN